MEDKKDCCCHKTKQRSDEEHKLLINRLNRIEGQIRGIKGMVENDAYCTDIITQVAAATAALNSFNKQLLSEHMILKPAKPKLSMICLILFKNL